MNEREALKLALEALERGETELRWKAITAIREALADHIGDANKMVEQLAHSEAVPEHCPVCSDEQVQDILKIGNPTEEEYRLIRMGWKAAQMAQPEQEPVATNQQIIEWANRHDFKGTITDLRCAFEDAQTVCATPPHRKPLTDEEIDAIYTGVRAVHHEIDSYVFARAIEAAHGIKD